MTEVKAELVGSVWKVTSKAGDEVAEDDVLMILESMKMEISVTAPRAGKVLQWTAARARSWAARTLARSSPWWKGFDRKSSTPASMASSSRFLSD